MPVAIILVLIVILAWFKVTEKDFKKVHNQLGVAQEALEKALIMRRSALSDMSAALQTRGIVPEEPVELPELPERIPVREMESIGDGFDAFEDSLFSLLEARPELKEDEELAEVLDQVREKGVIQQRARNYYNSGVMAINDAREELPSSIVAKVIGVNRRDFCDIRDYVPKTEPLHPDPEEEASGEDDAQAADGEIATDTQESAPNAQDSEADPADESAEDE